MAYTTGDIPESQRPKKEIQYRSKMQVTYEILPWLMSLPCSDQIRIRDVYVDPTRELVTFKFEGDSLLQGQGMKLFERIEAQEIPNYVPTQEAIINEMRRKVIEWDAKQAKKLEEK